MLFLKSKLLIFPKWVWLYGLLGWFSAEIVTVSTPVNKIDIGIRHIILVYPLLFVFISRIINFKLRKNVKKHRHPERANQSASG